LPAANFSGSEAQRLDRGAALVIATAIVDKADVWNGRSRLYEFVYQFGTWLAHGRPAPLSSREKKTG
jgi:hypothetical protein